MLQLSKSLSRLAIRPPSFPVAGAGSAYLHTSSAAFLQISDARCSALSKRKRKQDPGQVKAKEERRRKRLAKALKKMEKKDRLPKPLVECEIPIQLHQERSERLRGIEVRSEEGEARVLDMKDWARHCYVRNHNEIWRQDKIMITQQNALDELKKENVGLYEAAIMFDQELIPMTFKGPVATPPIEDYIQDGEYKDTTQSFKVIYEDTDAFMKELLQRNRKRKKKTEEEE